MSEKVTAGRDYLGGFAQAMEIYKDEEPGDKTPEALFGAGEKLEDTEHSTARQRTAGSAM